MVEPHVEDHPRLRKLIPLLADLEQLVVLVQLVSRLEGFQNDAALGVAAEGRTQVGARDVVDLFYHYCACSQRKLELELDDLPLIGALLHLGVFLEESLFVARHIGCQ